MFSCGKLVSINIQLIAQGPTGNTPEHPIHRDDPLIKRLDGAGNFLFSGGRQLLASEDSQFDQVLSLLLEYRQLLSFFDEVWARQASQSVFAGKECAQPTPPYPEINP